MNPALNVRVFTGADLGFADSLRALAGWNQTRADWERFLTTEPDGCFVAEWNGEPAGTATTTVYGSDLAWIGMMLVHPEFRRRGIGAALVACCLDYLRKRGVRCIKLDATPLGQPLYRQFGFREEWSLERWEGRRAEPAFSRVRQRVRQWGEEDLDSTGRVDEMAFGVSRARILRTLAGTSLRALVHESSGGEIDGFGLIRAGARASYLGPVVTPSADSAADLICALLDDVPDGEVYWDVPDQNTSAVELARRLGFTPQRPLVRMFAGDNRRPGDPRCQFAIAGPELG